MSEAGSGPGYVFAIADGSPFYIPNALHVERDDELFLYENDQQAARAAERDGVSLIYGMEDVPDGVYLDTPENRMAIQESLEAYPKYRTSAVLEPPKPRQGFQMK